MNIDKIGFGCSSHEELLDKKKKYALFNKGGGFRKWYGNQYFIIAFDMENYNVLATIGNHLPSRQYYFQSCITWNRISSAESFSARMCDLGYAFDDVSPSAFLARDNFNYAIGLMNSKPFCRLLCVMNRGMKTETGKLIMTFWCLITFFTAGFEHSVANMSLMMIGLLNPAQYDISIGGYAYNLAVVTIGNMVGGILFLAVPYFLIGKEKAAKN